jgi:oligogalacturonide lyase
MNAMSKGKRWPAEWTRYLDRITGIEVTQLTNYRSHSWHLYFTENGWYDEGRKLLFLSDRTNSTNLYQLDLSDGEITQLTDYGTEREVQSVCLHPSGRSAVMKHGGASLTLLQLDTLEERSLYEAPAGFKIGNVNCTADGAYAVTCIQEDLSGRILLDLGNGYVGHRELMEAAPLSKIITIELASGDVKEVFEDRCFITHINTSPTLPWLITYCHEGPWHLVDHRIWGLDLRNGETWKIRHRLEPKEKVGHEFFYPDGETIGYHGFRENGTNFFGKIRYDNTEMEETEFTFDTWHSHADGYGHVVVDGKGPIRTISIWKKQGDGTGYDGPRTLCELRCSFHSQKVHAHPRFDEKGERLLFTSDKNGYANLYLVNLPQDLSRLPRM